MQGRDIERRHVAAASALWAAAVATLLGMGRPPICRCGWVELWHPALDAGNSQHIADWYTPSHILHGLIFSWIGRLTLGRRLADGWLLVFAVAMEGAWELVENSPAVIERYREATIALGYSGDSVLNSAADIGWMAVGFLLARRLPWWGSLLLGVVFELAALWAVRDNLALNVLMLLWPLDAVRVWQTA